MNLLLKLIVECHCQNNIWIATKDNDIPFCKIKGDPKQDSADLLECVTSYKINPYDLDWLVLELTDTGYDAESKTAYLVYVCRVPEKSKLPNGYEWTTYADIKSKIDLIKGVL